MRVEKGIAMGIGVSEEQLLALQEMSIVGMDHAAIALSQLMKREIRLKVPRVMTMDVARLSEFFGGGQQMVVGVYLQILGDARGNIMMIFTREDAIKMLELLLSRNRGKGTLMTELEVSALKEVGNILASAYLNALGDMFKMTLIPSVPLLTLDMAGAVVDYVLNELGEGGEVSVLIDTEFAEGDNSFTGHFFMLPAFSSFNAMLAKNLI
jgi:chemotaxis protein CheC